MSGYTFTPAADSPYCANEGDPDATARYQLALAKLKPSCSRCGRTLGKRELAGGVCAAKDECRIRQTFSSAEGRGKPGVTEYRRLRAYIAEHGSPFVRHGSFVHAGPPIEELPPDDDTEAVAAAENEGMRPPMLDPGWTPEAGYGHASGLLGAFARQFA